MKKQNWLSLLIVGLIPFSAFAQTMYSYTRLALKDLDEMNKIVQDKIEQSKNAPGDGKVGPLQEALQAVFARSNEDLMIEKIITPLKNELEDLESWETSVGSMVDDALRGLKDPEKMKPVAQVTYLIMLENILQEFKPRATDKFEAMIITRIRDAKIKLSKAASKERRLKTMKDVKSPSDIADGILKAQPKPKKK